MINGLWGKKVGMTQLFSKENKVVPVTVVDVSNWYITGIKTEKRDGYHAIQVGRLKDRFQGSAFAAEWIKQPKYYFSFIKEIRLAAPLESATVGSPANFHTIVQAGDALDVSGRTKGCGFAGVVRRHNFTGAPASHGATMGKRTGSIGFMSTQGRVIKGKKMPGHMGNVQRMAKNLQVVDVEESAQVVFVRGSVPGKAGSLLFMKKI